MSFVMLYYQYKYSNPACYCYKWYFRTMLFVLYLNKLCLTYILASFLPFIYFNLSQMFGWRTCIYCGTFGIHFRKRDRLKAYFTSINRNEKHSISFIGNELWWCNDSGTRHLFLLLVLLEPHETKHPLLPVSFAKLAGKLEKKQH